MRNYDMGAPSTPPDISKMRFDEVVEAMVEWFFHNFEDPAENTPFESAEGGYQWIWGGPCDATEELEDAFGKSLEDTFGETMHTRALKAAVDRIEEDNWEWAPSSSRMQEEREPDDVDQDQDL